MCKEEVDFITRLPRSHNIFYNLVDDLDCKISSDTAVKYGDRIVFIKSKKVDVYGNKIYAHVILDENKQAKDIQHILKNKLDCEQTKAEREALDKKLKYAGFLILLSKSAIEAKDILPNYYTRQAIEQIFGFAKSNNNILPLRVHSEKSINGYLLLVFISLIIFVTMRQKLQPKITMDKALIQLRALKAKIYDDQILIMEPNKKVKNIAKTLNIILPKKMGV
jgi:transposase